MLSKISIIIEREYRTRVFKKSFIWMTLLMPVLMLVSFGAVPMFMALGAQDKQVVAVIDRTGQYASLFTSGKGYEFYDESPSILAQARKQGEEAQLDREYTAFLEIRQDLREDPEAWSLFSFKTIPDGLEAYIEDRLEQYLTEQKLIASGVENIQAIVDNSKTKLKLNTYKIGDDGADSNTSGTIASVIGMVMTILIYMMISIYGGMVLQGVMEEKKTRIMEVMISSVRPFQLMMGKIIGIGLVGITQMLLWALLGILGFVGLQFAMIGGLYSPESIELAQTSGRLGAEEAQQITQMLEGVSSVAWGEIGILFILFFVGGYFLSASLYAAFGSAISNEEDAGPLAGTLSLVMMMFFYMGLACFQSPESTMAVVASYFPLTSPMVMVMRATYGVALWEEVLSIALLYVSAIGVVYLSAKIYRTGVLMYGKKPSFKEIIRWIRVS